MSRVPDAAPGEALTAGDATHGPWLLDQPALESWGMGIGQHADRPLILTLTGDLGAGKSVLARAVARGAGVTGAMPSPTFNLLYRYETPAGAIVHIDLYRLADPDDVWELGWRELGGPGEIALIEWPERAESLLPSPRWNISLVEPSPGASVREVRVTRHGLAPDLPLPG